MILKVHHNLNNSDIIIDIPDEHGPYQVETQTPNCSMQKKFFNDSTEIESKTKMFEQQMIDDLIRKQSQQMVLQLNKEISTEKKKTIVNRHQSHSVQHKKPSNPDDVRQREDSLKRVESFMKQFKNRVDKTAKDLEERKQNICYQVFDEKLDSKEKKILFLKIKVLEMQLNLQRAEDYIEKQLPISTTSREQLIESLLDYLFTEEEKEKNLKKNLRPPKKKTIIKNNFLFQGLANVNMAISQEFVDCTPKTGMRKQNQIIHCQICYEDVLGSQSIKLSAQWQQYFSFLLKLGQFFDWYLVDQTQFNSQSFLIDHQFCLQCIEKYISFRVKDGRCTHIYCPETDCKCVYTDKEIQKIISKQMFQTYLKIKKHSLINSDPQIRYCQKGVCDSYIKFTPGNQVDNCSYCNSKVCFDCYMPSHKGMSCEQSMERKLQSLIHAIRKGDCPFCKNQIMKIQVENAVRCPSCNYDFCWLCNKKYSKYHYKFWNFCSGCPNMLEAIEPPTFMNKFKYFRQGLMRFLVIMILSMFLLCGYILSLIILPIFVPGGVFLYYNYKTFEKRSIFEQFLIGVLLLAVGIIGYFIWLILCIFPGIIMAFKKFYYLSDAYLESLGYK